MLDSEVPTLSMYYLPVSEGELIKKKKHRMMNAM